MRAWLGWAVGTAVLMALSIGAGSVVRSYPPREIDVNMLFVPPSEAVKKGASGYDNLIADSLWLTLLQYYGERYFADDRTMHNLDAAFGLITDLDPKFWFAYWLGAWALGDDKQAEEAIVLLQKGERANPEYVNYPYLEGFVRFLYLGDYRGAAAAFERAYTKPIAEWPDQRRFCRTMAARMYQKQGKDTLALEIWKKMYEGATDKALKDIAKRNVQRIEDELAGRRKPAFKPGAKEPGRVVH